MGVYRLLGVGPTGPLFRFLVAVALALAGAAPALAGVAFEGDDAALRDRAGVAAADSRRAVRIWAVMSRWIL